MCLDLSLDVFPNLNTELEVVVKWTKRSLELWKEKAIEDSKGFLIKDNYANV